MSGNPPVVRGSLPPGLCVLGEYVLDRPIERGRTWVVYSARHGTRKDERYWVRVLRRDAALQPARSEAFAREVQLLSTLAHSGIVPLVAAGMHDGTAVMVTREIQGETLRARLARLGTGLAPEDVSRIICAVASVLDYLHGREVPIVHRALDPGKIVLAAPDDDVKVLEVGYAHALRMARLDSSEGDGRAARAHRAAEERISAHVHPAADQFALASVAYECMTGRAPFTNDPDQSARITLEGPAPRVAMLRPELPPTIDAVLSRAWAIDPAQRFPSVGAFAEALAAALREGHSPSDAAGGFSDAPTRISPLADVPVGETISSLAAAGIELAADEPFVDERTIDALFDGIIDHGDAPRSEAARAAAALTPRAEIPTTVLRATRADEEPSHDKTGSGDEAHASSSSSPQVSQEASLATKSKPASAPPRPPLPRPVRPSASMPVSSPSSPASKNLAPGANDAPAGSLAPAPVSAKPAPAPDGALLVTAASETSQAPAVHTSQTRGGRIATLIGMPAPTSAHVPTELGASTEPTPIAAVDVDVNPADPALTSRPSTSAPSAAPVVPPQPIEPNPPAPTPLRPLADGDGMPSSSAIGFPSAVTRYSTPEDPTELIPAKTVRSAVTEIEPGPRVRRPRSAMYLVATALGVSIAIASAVYIVGVVMRPRGHATGPLRMRANEDSRTSAQVGPQLQHRGLDTSGRELVQRSPASGGTLAAVLPDAASVVRADDAEVARVDHDAASAQSASREARIAPAAADAVEGRLRPRPSSRDVMHARREIEQRINQCPGRYGRHARLAVTYEGTTGRATSIRIAGDYFSRRPIGECIERAVQDVPLPRFSRPAWTTDYVFMVH